MTDQTCISLAMQAIATHIRGNPPSDWWIIADDANAWADYLIGAAESALGGSLTSMLLRHTERTSALLRAALGIQRDYLAWQRQQAAT